MCCDPVKPLTPYDRVAQAKRNRRVFSALVGDMARFDSVAKAMRLLPRQGARIVQQSAEKRGHNHNKESINGVPSVGLRATRDGYHSLCRIPKT